MSTPAPSKKTSQQEGSFRIPNVDADRHAPRPGGAATPADAPPDEQGSFRLDALAPAGMDALPDAPSKSRIPTQIVLFVVLLAAGGGALFAMRHFGMGPVSALGEVEINYDYTKRPGATDHNRVLKDLTASNVARQVPAEEVQKNPFSLVEANLATEAAPTPGPEKPNPGKTEEDKRRLAELARQQEIQSTLASLHIHGIMTGDTPVARIGDETVRVGDTVAGMFLVTAIEGRSVTLEVDDTTYTISLDDQPRRPRGRPSSNRPPTSPRK